MKTHAVIYGEGAQTIKTVPTGLDGEPILLASVEARIVDLLYSEDSDDRDIVAKAAATVDSTTSLRREAVESTTAFVLPNKEVVESATLLCQTRKRSSRPRTCLTKQGSGRLDRCIVFDRVEGLRSLVN